jgi:hypothetical protein
LDSGGGSFASEKGLVRGWNSGEEDFGAWRQRLHRVSCAI